VPDKGEKFAIIGGSGFNDLGADAAVINVTTPYGAPSGTLRELKIGDNAVVFLARHGDAHTIAPHEINYRANVAALKEQGVNSIIALNTVGVIPKLPAPGSIAIPDQLIDYTYGRAHSIHGNDSGTLEHVDFTEPFSATLRRALMGCAAKAGIDVHDGGVYAVTQGPRLETAAEINRYEKDGAQYVGMTAMPEAIIARELGIDYLCICLVVNYGAGRGDRAIHDDIEISMQETRIKAMSLLGAFFGGSL
jgi:5'-deoxy-5'-methylthioadenosine phosphorylase